MAPEFCRQQSTVQRVSLVDKEIIYPPEYDPDEWRTRAACKNMTDLFFQPGRGNPDTRALNICRNECPVRWECLEFAVTQLRHVEAQGVWGGYGTNELRRIRRERRREAAKRAS